MSLPKATGPSDPTISSPQVNDTVPTTFTAVGTFLDVATVTTIYCKLDGGGKQQATINVPRAGVWKLTFSNIAVGAHKLVVERYVSGTLDGSSEVDPFTVADPPAVTIGNLNQGDTKANGFTVTGTVTAGRTVTARLIPRDMSTNEQPQAVSIDLSMTTWSNPLSAASAGYYLYEVRAALNTDPTNVVVTRIGELEIT